MVREYSIKYKKDGQGWIYLMSPIYADCWHAAKVEFKDWMISWLDNINNDTSIELQEEIIKEPAKDTYRSDNFTYTIRRI
jgi:hypothetical protein